MKTILLDATALVALLRGHERVFELWAEKHRFGGSIIIPASAIVAANKEMALPDSHWQAVLEDERAAVLPLTESNALTASRCHGDLITAHVTVEAVATDAVIVTRSPTHYPGKRIFAFN